MSRAGTLRTRLVLIVVALMAGGSIVVGAVSIVVLNSYLVQQLDDSLRLSAYLSRLTAPPQPSVGESDCGKPNDQFYATPGKGIGTISGLVCDGKLYGAGYPDDQTNIRYLTVSQLEHLAKVRLDGQPQDLYLGSDLGDYRVIADQTSTGWILTGVPLAYVQRTTAQLVLVLALVAAAGIAAAAFVANLMIGYALRPLNRVATTASAVAELPLDRGDVDLSVRVPESDTDPSSEVGKVGAALNRLLSHVGQALVARQRSEDKVRRFVADASHELRTPLASIRGYSELTRRTQEKLSPEIQHNLLRIESEAVRMTSLVEDLLLLARLDSQRELRQDEVDLSILVVEAVGDAHAAGPEHEWTVDLPDEPVIVHGDDPRLRQVVVNLLANARTHTPGGTVVTASVERIDDEAVLRVADNGPGIPEEQIGALFERFTRGDSSRTRATGSTGLGLSIVKAVAEAHGGSVDVESRPGRTVFTVRLPVAAGSGPSTTENESDSQVSELSENS